MNYTEILNNIIDALRRLSTITSMAFGAVACIFFAIYRKIRYNTNELLKMLQFQKDETEALKKEFDEVKRQLSLYENDVAQLKAVKKEKEEAETIK